jgi:hypothetical protein
MNPSFYVMMALILMAFVFLFSSLGKKGMEPGPSSTGNKSFSSVMVGVAMVLFFVLLFLFFLQRIYGWNIATSFHGLLSGHPTLDLVAKKKTYKPKLAILPTMNDSTLQPQVFNIPGNFYSYDDAKTLCQAYGARLATYDEIEDAYNSGGEWCNYGWSHGQMALFPTQKSTFQTLQHTPGHEHDCGRPGVNGGYMANPQLKFGVNCFGNKPRINQEEEQMMKRMSPYPKNDQDILHDEKVEYWRSHMDDILVSPFNRQKWSK